jgi:arginine decarboxylase
LTDPLGPAWSLEDSAELYGVSEWSDGYFAVGPAGHVHARPRRDPGAEIDLVEVVRELRGRGLGAPWILRFADALTDRREALGEAFAQAVRENDYAGSYRAVYPIKVNQQAPVVEHLVAHTDCGLEVGSKPELLAAVATTVDDPDRLIVCNGFKDGAYLEGAVLATKLGRNIITVIENRGELQPLLAHARRYGVSPQIGARVKLASVGAGRWRSSAGTGSKFGLFATELLAMIEMLQQQGFLDSFVLLHAHAGSQLQDIRRVKEVVGELSHVYAELRHLGAPLRFLDVGGGLGVDYDGRRTNASSSMNYSLAEYASEVVYRVGSICSQRGVPHPDIVTESGRALVAHHAVLVFEAVATITRDEEIRQPEEPSDDAPQAIRDLYEALLGVSESRALESFHDAVTARRQAVELFAQGFLSLELRAMAESLFFATCSRVRRATQGMDPLPDELQVLEVILADTYVSNLSIFQDRQAVLADVTCDSDGQINRFCGNRDITRVLPLHTTSEEQPYYLGAFLIGAYQETLGDLHNLFGDPHVAVVELTDDGYRISRIVEGDTAREVLEYVSFDTAVMRDAFVSECDRASSDGRLRPEDREALVAFFERELRGYTYLREDDD